MLVWSLARGYCLPLNPGAFVQLIRAWIESLRPGEGGWLRALGDPQLALAIEAIHHEPGGAWTVASLASRAGMSRSAFAGRFKSVGAGLGSTTPARAQLVPGVVETESARPDAVPARPPVPSGRPSPAQRRSGSQVVPG